MSTLTQAHFDAGELMIWRRVGRHRFHLREIVVVDFFLARSFRLCRAAAFVKDYRQLAQRLGFGASSGHTNAIVNRLRDTRVLLSILPNWDTFNMNFLEWNVPVRKISEGFEDQETLPFEPEVRALLTEAHLAGINNLSLQGFPFTSSNDSAAAPGDEPGPRKQTSDQKDRERAGVSDPTGCSDIKEVAGKASPPPQLSKFPVCTDGWGALTCELIDAGKTIEEEAVPFSGTEHQNPVPENGTGGCAGKWHGHQPGKNPNDDKGFTDPVPENGTAIASLAFLKEAKLAIGRVNNSETRRKKEALAPEFLARMDPKGFKRFANQWRPVCRRFPDYVIDELPRVYERNLKKYGDVPNPLALFAIAARLDGKM